MIIYKKHKSNISTTNNYGFSLVEVLLAIAIFSLVVPVFAGAVIYGQQTAVSAGQQLRATGLAEEGIEIVRSIRDENFNNLHDGVYGVGIENGILVLKPPSDTTGIFLRTLTLSSVSTS